MPGTSYEYTVCGCHVGYQKDSYTKIAQAVQITVTGENVNIQSAQKIKTKMGDGNHRCG